VLKLYRVGGRGGFIVQGKRIDKSRLSPHGYYGTFVDSFHKVGKEEWRKICDRQGEKDSICSKKRRTLCGSDILFPMYPAPQRIIYTNGKKPTQEPNKHMGQKNNRLRARWCTT
jgi:hypothetical protein